MCASVAADTRLRHVPRQSPQRHQGRVGDAAAGRDAEVQEEREALVTLEYTKRGFRLKNGRLHLAGGIVVRPVWSRQLPRQPSSVRVYRDSVGHWWGSFVTAAVAEEGPATGHVIGIDWGVKEIATTTSDDHDLPHPQHGRTAAQKLARYQRMMARRRPPKGQAGSKGYREAQRPAAKLHKKVANQRQDTGRTWAKTVVRDHDALAVEDFRPTFLAKSTMARKAADAAISATKAALVEMGLKHGRAVHLVHPAHTTMTARSAEREPSTHYLFRCERMPAPGAAPCPRGTRTAPA